MTRPPLDSSVTDNSTAIISSDLKNHIFGHFICIQIYIYIILEQTTRVSLHKNPRGGNKDNIREEYKSFV